MKKIEIYLVSLPQDERRREILREAFPTQYPQFQLIPAIYGPNLLARDFFRLCTPIYRRDLQLLTPAEIGCSLSHIIAYEKLLASDADVALILEDDVIGDDKKIESILEIINELPRYSIFFAGAQADISDFQYLTGKQAPISKSGVIKLRPFQYRFIWRTCAYAVTREAATQLLGLQNKTLRKADSWKIFLKKIDAAVYYSEILRHPADLRASHIESDRMIVDDVASAIYARAGATVALALAEKIKSKISKFLAKILRLFYGPHANRRHN